MIKALALLLSHAAVLALGFAAGIYALPLLIEQPAPQAAALNAVATTAVAKGQFDPDIAASDWLHWGRGEVWLSPTQIAFSGTLAPGPDYRLYLSPVAIGSAEEFLQHKAQMTVIGDVRSFAGFVLALPPHSDPASFRAAIIWCESFGQFISATPLTPTALGDAR